MNDRIVLDRENLLRLIRAIGNPPIFSEMSNDFIRGYDCALQVLESIAREMPTVQPAILPASATDTWMDHMALCPSCSAGPDFCDVGAEMVVAAREERDGA